MKPENEQILNEIIDELGLFFSHSIEEDIKQIAEYYHKQQLLIHSVSRSCPQDVAENIVTELDAFGRSIHSVEFGLPIIDFGKDYEKCLQIVKDNYR